MEKLNEDKIRQIVSSIVEQICENYDYEGFSFGTRGRASDHKFKFVPGENDTNTDTKIFNYDKSLRVNKVMLEKSKVMTYNLYKIKYMPISRALKHPEEFDRDEESIDKFMKRSAQYIKYIIGNKPVDIITFPQSSSNFNTEMTNYLLRLYPKSEGIKLVPNLLTKNVRNVYVNISVAKSLGLTDAEIHNLQGRVGGWKQDEDLRDLRRKINALEAEIIQTKTTRGRGRPTKEFTNKVELLNTYNEQLPLLRKGRRGKDSTVDGNNNIKDFQIKSLNDKDRRSIEGLFEINPELNGYQQKLIGKHVIIFDDNISSGATLDDICLTLKRLGVASITPITLAIIPKTIYGNHEA